MSDSERIAELEEELAELQQDLDNANDEIDVLQDDLDGAEERETDARKEGYEEAIQDAKNAIANLE